MTRFLLLRHAQHDWVGRGIAGRSPQVSLNDEGRAQAQALVQPLQAQGIDAICSSPQPRARETVAPLAAHLGLPVAVEPAFDEVDFGEWCGLSFDELRARGGADWDEWVNRRGRARPPGGEPFAQVQRRAVEGMHRLRALHPGGCVLVVSHADVLKSVVAHVLGLSLDQLERFEIAPASVTVVDAGEGWAVLKEMNLRWPERACERPSP